jgi:hypothetical protein
MSATQALQILETPQASPARSISMGDEFSLQSSPSSPQKGGAFAAAGRSELRSSLVGLQSHPVGSPIKPF